VSGGRLVEDGLLGPVRGDRDAGLGADRTQAGPVRGSISSKNWSLYPSQCGSHRRYAYVHSTASMRSGAVECLLLC
jgi:hypothetical protein